MPSTTDYAQIKLEETPRYEGAPSITPYRLSSVIRYMPAQGVRLDPAPSFLSRADEVRGIEGALAELIDGYAPAGQIRERMYLNDLVFLLQCAGLTDTITPGDGIITDPDGATIPATAYRHVFAKRGGITAQTLQLILSYFDEGVFLKGQGFGVSNLALNAAGEMTADLMGLVVANVADPSLTASYDAGTIVPLRRGDLTLTWLGSTGVTDDFSLAITNPLVARRTLGLTTPSYFPDVMEHGDERVYLRGTMPKATLADADVNALLAGTTFSATAKWKSPKVIAATVYVYSMWIQMPSCQYVGGSFDEIANRRRFGGSFDFFAAYDEGQAYDFKITICNAVAAVGTFSGT